MAGAKGVRISEFDVPSDTVQPGDMVTARIDATNTSNFIGPWDADKCNDGNVGLLIEGVVVGPDGEEHVGESVCAPQHDIIQSYEVTSEVTFEVPESDGVHQYEAFIRTVETAKKSSRLTGQIDVFAEESDSPEEAPDDDDAGTSPWESPNDDGDNGSNLFGGSSFEQIDLLILAALAIAAMYLAGNLFDIGIGSTS